MEWKWLWKAKVVRVIDGDTIEVMADRGYGDYRKMRLRLKDINTPELTDKDPVVRAKAVAAKEYLESLLPPDTILVFESFKLSFDRYVADIWFESDYLSASDVSDISSLQAKLIDSGHATYVISK